MNTAIKTKTETDVIELSPSSIRTFNSCKARWVYENLILPKIETERTREITRFGTLFHQIAEHNFRKDKFGSILFGEKLSVRNELELYADRVKQRDYFNFPSVNEQFMKISLEPEFIYRGIADRICYLDDRVMIVDYKTSAMPDPMKDRIQGLAYIYLLSNTEAIDPKRITLTLDYVRTDEIYQFQASSKDMKEYGEFLRNTFIQASILKEAFLTHGQIRKIPHCVGDCSFCPMVGSCMAYQSVLNPVPEPLDINLDTEALALELISVDGMKKLYDERSKALKQALLLRNEAGDTLVRDFCSVVESKTTVFPVESVLNRIMPEIVRTAVRNDRYKYLIDSSRLSDELVKSLLSLLPDNLSPQSIPAEYAATVNDLQITQPRAKYLKPKKVKGAR